jgi:hypothetical protein
VTQPRTRSARIRAFSMLVCALVSQRAAFGDYQVVGTTEGGGQIIIGRDSITQSLSKTSCPVALTPSGFDSVTIATGAQAQGSGADTIEFGSSHNYLLNNGSIVGCNNQSYGAVVFGCPATLLDEQVVNNGLIQGGNGGGGQAGGNGIEFSSGGCVNDIPLVVPSVPSVAS